MLRGDEMTRAGNPGGGRTAVENVHFEMQVVVLQAGMAAFFCLGIMSGAFGDGSGWRQSALTWIICFQALHIWSVLRRRSLSPWLERVIPVADITCVTAAWLSLGDPASPLWAVHLFALVGYSRRLDPRSYRRLALFIVLNVAVGGLVLGLVAGGGAAAQVNIALSVMLTGFMAVFAGAVGDAWRTAELRVRELAETDPLTGIANRRTLFQYLEGAAFAPEDEFAVLMVDLDNFKALNDERGHLFGDQVLMETAALLEANIRPVDRVGRYGGEEFVIVLPGATLDGAEQIGERLRAEVAAHTPTSITVGCAARRWGESAESVLRRADDLLLAAKRMGKNMVVTGPATAAA